MGHVYSTYIGSPDTMPNFRAPATFDPLYGFENGRKERVMQATEEEMDAAGLRSDQRDYCAHLVIDFYKCRRESFPWVASCSEEKHKWDHCEREDFILRMKEYERERRLLERAKRKGITQNKEEFED